MRKAMLNEQKSGGTAILEGNNRSVAVIDDMKVGDEMSSPSVARNTSTDSDYLPTSIVLSNGMTYYLDKPVRIANAGPIGLMAFGITTTLLNIVNAGLVNSSAIVIVVAYGALHGGLVQVLAGMWEMKRGSTFAALAFSSYGAFWMGFALMQIMLKIGWFTATDLNEGLCAWLSVWGFFTLLMWINTFRMNRALQWVFGTLTVLFILLAGGEYNPTVKKIAGWVGMVCGLSAMYVGWAELTNEVFERTLLPLFPVKPKQPKEPEYRV